MFATPSHDREHEDRTSLFDKIKDAVTTTAGEAAEEAAAKAKEAQKTADEAAKKAGLPTDADKAAAVKKAAADKAAAEKAAAEKTKEAEERAYTVVSGDTLSAIGAKFGVDWQRIAQVNNVENPDLIFPGQVFKIPNN